MSVTKKTGRNIMEQTVQWHTVLQLSNSKCINSNNL